MRLTVSFLVGLAVDFFKSFLVLLLPRVELSVLRLHFCQ